MMNKGLEVIEAHHLFHVPVEQVQVVVHPQSIIHSMVEFHDGSVLAQLGIPDMRIPISYALAYPERLPNTLPSLDLFQVQTLQFYPPDLERFPCLRLAFEAARLGGTMPAVLNAANEIAVQAFPRWDDRLSGHFHCHRSDDGPAYTVATPEDVTVALQADHWAREYAEAAVKEFALSKTVSILLLATGGYSGYAPMAPGTCGSVVGLLVFLCLAWLPVSLYMLVLVACTALGIWVAGQAEQLLGGERCCPYRHR